MYKRIPPLARFVLVALAVASIAACSSLEPRPGLPIEMALPPGTTTALDREATAEEARHPNASAFRLVISGEESLVTRVNTARTAGRSLDVQTYIWHADQTGLYLAAVLLEAADRGVKVRLLIDDLDARAKNVGLAALSAHANLDVRLFNPFATRSGTFRKVREGLSSFNRLNRRMHNKTWIADNQIAVAGGRNLGDEYFGANEAVNFIDLEFAMIGPVVRDASASFDKYWNSEHSYPIELLDPENVNAAALDTARVRLAAKAREAETTRYAQALLGNDAIRRLISGEWPIEWSSIYKFVSDDPAKVGMEEYDASRSHVAAAIAPLLLATSQETRIISPYFVPGKKLTAELAKLAASGKSVGILTNSLVANDVAAVHGGYAQYRKALLEGGVKLWELKPVDGIAESSLFGSSGASLHTKALSVDERQLFVGSYNLDPRSTWLNCEQGVLVDNAVLVKQFAAIFDMQTRGEEAWRVTLNKEDNDLSWSDGTDTYDSEPKASAWRRFQAWLSRVLGLEEQL